ncbi:hypothetical protein T12_8612 [Trichinella patagoniensis]|uniref:Uncharacterized protein n=1 Tax=Trichinella patagoniensis TaxID=990121 RepID=A0A0V0YTR5_9BILA|nr:hypothetical protein T12_8612 [Trichinella patagoniensis]
MNSTNEAEKRLKVLQTHSAVDIAFSVLSIRDLLADERNKIRHHHPKFAC